MAAGITSWVRKPIQSLTMSRPRTRKLWCALSDDLQQSFPMECVADQDDIDTLKKKIWEEIKEEIKDTAARNLKLYSPVVQLNNEEEFEDPDVDIVVVVSGGATTQNQKRPGSQSVNISRKRPITENLLICPRERTMSKLAAILDDMNIVHVCGTPASGKTCLSELLRDYYCKEGRRVFLIKKWEELDSEDPWGSLIKLIKKGNKELEDAPTTSFATTSLNSENDLSWVLTSNTVILVNEAQKTYNDNELWNTILKERQTPTCVYNFQLCLFCSYGSPEAGPD
ncbi:hypothetical protein SI65_08146 [Aspergillus cristatus]|uniref:Crinkler effector protein N-terminal domain-containing protein n=1 Tax=Aspergillus cristatus TaxID=573508 RepID=A0A1E3B6T2_ASPCR|nr:hypothetical protein SI65_08146 [Aspergillus cristatus]